MTDIGCMVRSANPVPDDSQQLTDSELGAVLLLAQQRSTDMDVQELTKPVEPEPKRRGWLIAAIAFGAVILVAGLAIVLTQGTNDEIPPATTPSTTIADVAPTTTIADVAPTTTVPDNALTPEEEAFVAGFFGAFNTQDEAALLALASPDARFTSYLIVDEVPDVWAKELAWRWALGEEWSPDSCSLSFSAISCQVTITGGLFRFLESQEAVLRMSVVDGVATSVSLKEDLTVLIGAGSEVLAWLEAEHPDKVATMNAAGEPPPPRLTDESIALWRELMPDFWAQRAG